MTGTGLLDGIDPEDSWVLAIRVEAGILRVDAEFSLLPGHARYAPPRVGEWGSYARGSLVLEGFTALHWTGAGGRVHRDPDGSTDLGSFDTLDLGEPIVLAGDFGALRVEGATARIDWAAPEESPESA